MKKVKLASRRPSVKQLDDLAREVVRARDKRCRMCGSEKFLQISHFITRGNRAIRWDLDNLFLLCSGCHCMRQDSWHKNPAVATDFVKDALGQDRYLGLRMRACTTGQKLDMWAVKIYLQQELKKYAQ